MSKCLVLLVEDDKILTGALTAVMEEKFAVESVHTIAEASARIVQTPYPDVILLDLILPNGAGIDLIDKFQNDHPAIPIVVLSGYAISEAAALRAGAVAVLMKPVGRDQLNQVLGGVIAKYVVGKWFGPVAHSVRELKAELEELTGKKIL